MNTLIVLCDTERGYYAELRGTMTGMGIRAVAPTAVEYQEENQDGALRRTEIWSCMKEDVPAIVEEISKYFAGKEIKIYDLTAAYTRIPGELKTLTVSKDGKLPF